MTADEAKEYLESIVFEDFAPMTQKAILAILYAFESLEEVVDKCGEYISIGMTPEQVKEMKVNLEEYQKIGSVDAIKSIIKASAKMIVDDSLLKEYQKIGTLEDFKHAIKAIH